ncbi:MAG: hypothetical protein ACYDDB_08645 [bacterium]
MPKIKKTNSSSKKKQSADIISLPRREAMEGMFFGVFDDRKNRAVEKAQDIMYDAWDAPTKKEAADLARKALKVSADCTDAYVLLAEETAQTLAEATELYRQGVEAGERYLGKKMFKEYEGHFWGIISTRPYMRARAGLAQCLWESGWRNEAVEHYKDMLRLNPGDNQGNRFMLMPRLIELGRDKDAEELFGDYSGDGSVFWLYSRALFDFRQQGDSTTARDSLKAAIKENKHVPDYLLSKKRMPAGLPSQYILGGNDEAVIYANDNMGAWKTTPGAINWLSKHC